jgi:anti-anti-sigma factor
MQFTAEPLAGFTILHLRGELDTLESPRLTREISSLRAAGASRLALNLWRVQFINSTAMGAIVRESRDLAARDGKLVISRPSVFCRDLFEKIRLDLVVPIYDSDAAAGRALMEAERGAVSESGREDPEQKTRVFFSPCDLGRTRRFIPEVVSGESPVAWCGVGQLIDLKRGGLHFLWNGNNTRLTPFEMGQLLALGTEIRVKVGSAAPEAEPHQAVVRIVEVREHTDGVELAAVFRAHEQAARAVGD